MREIGQTIRNLIVAILVLAALSPGLGSRAWAGTLSPDSSITALTQAERGASLELPQVVVSLKPGSDPAAFAKANGLTLVREMLSLPGTYIFSTETVTATQRTVQQAKAQVEKDGRVLHAYVNHRTRLVKYGFTPDDPYFHAHTPTTSWRGDWHLINELGSGIDVDAEGAWAANATGDGVVVAVVDDGLQINHPDLSPHYDAADSWNFGTHGSNPSPVTASDSHGTMVAGVAAAAGGNAIGVCGAAPRASLSCLRLDFNTNVSSEADTADADMYHSSGQTTTIKIKNHSYGYSDPWLDLPLERTAFTTSAAAGTIHVFAAGNGRDSYDPSVTADADKAMYQNIPEVIAVAALDRNGLVKDYSSFGSCVFVAAPSGLLTTDRTSTAGDNSGGSGAFPDLNYVDDVEGTSFSSPLVAGVLALVKQVQPALDVRFAKHLLARCSDKVDASDSSTESGGGWQTNAAGLAFNENYGFGLINATRLIDMAGSYTGVLPLQTETTGKVTVNLAIPDNNTAGVTTTFTLASTTPLEEMLLTVNITHSYIGDLDAYLTSPQGTTSRLMIQDDMDATRNLDWTLLSNAFWGENPTGKWTLKVRDTAARDTGTLVSYTATARMGYLVNDSSAELLDYP